MAARAAPTARNREVVAVATVKQTSVRTCRLLYYGPAGVGKRENLGVIHRTIPPESRLAIASDDPERQIAFQFRKPGEEPWQVVLRALDTGAESLPDAAADEVDQLTYVA